MGENAKVNEKRRFLTKIGSFFGKFITLLPIVASIVAPMVLFFGGFVYISYFLFLYPFVDIVNFYFIFETTSIILPIPKLISLLVVDVILFLFGLYLFLDALITMSPQKTAF